MNSNMGVTHQHNLEKLFFCPLIWSLSLKLISVKILSQLYLELHGFWLAEQVQFVVHKWKSSLGMWLQGLDIST